MNERCVYNMENKLVFSFYCGVLAIALALFIGWILNLIEIIATFSGPLTGMLIARLVGVLTLPLGGVLGYF